ncbi:hypothetical protein CRYUN_Cryun10bG0085800 [Craigia yunnanensis]
MGQVQSDAAAVDASNDQAPIQHASPSSMDSLIAEAAAYGNDENQSLDAQAQKALECPCVAELRNGACGVQFTEAFLCFLKSTAEEKVITINLKPFFFFGENGSFFKLNCSD